jgi:hypothetical protein
MSEVRIVLVSNSVNTIERAYVIFLPNAMNADNAPLHQSNEWNEYALKAMNLLD